MPKVAAHGAVPFPHSLQSDLQPSFFVLNPFSFEPPSYLFQSMHVWLLFFCMMAFFLILKAMACNGVASKAMQGLS